MIQDIDSSFRSPKDVKGLAKAIRRITTQEWNIMEICGGQTHSLAKYNIEEMLPPEIRLIHGPGCPVCVTSVSVIDHAVHLAMQPGVCLCTFGDMMRVPGTKDDLLSAKARGGNVKMLYSPLDALRLAVENPQQQIVFFAIGFETTLPIYALAVIEAQRLKLTNFSILPALVSVPPAMEALLSDPENIIDGFLAAGHVCAVTGTMEYNLLANQWQVPIVIAGFEPADLLYGIFLCIKRLESGEINVDNAYSRIVTSNGNMQALQKIKQVFYVSDQEWRGLGILKNSGFKINETYKQYDATKRFHLKQKPSASERCEAGKILSGKITPYDCPEFGQRCTPEHPLGAPMVSTEGVCSAYYRYKRYNYDRTQNNRKLSVTEIRL